MDDTIQWHPAFCSALKIELGEDADALVFEEEYRLGKKPMQADMLIRKISAVQIKKKIGHIFRGYNLVEYKSPDDWLSADDYYKVCAYACLYLSDAEGTLAIDPRDMTLTFACSHYPRKFLEHIKEIYQISIREYAPGILHLLGGMFPMQLILVNRLPPEEYYWMQNLRKDLKSGGEIRRLIERYDQYKRLQPYQIVMDVILKANWEEAEVERKMCEALRQLFAEDFKKCEQRGMRLGLEQGEKLGLERGEKLGLERGEKLGLERGEKLGLERGAKLGQERGELLGIELAKKVFRLSAQGVGTDEIARLCGISVEKARGILQ